MASEWHRLISVLILAIPAGMGWMLWTALDRRIETVQVVSPLSPEESSAVTAAVYAALDGGILSADIDKVADALIDLSWPRSVSVRRVWPDRLDVEVLKSTLIARWKDGLYLTSTGALVVSAEPALHLPLFECEMATPREAMEMYGLLHEIAAQESLELTALQQNRIGEWQIRFADQMTVNLGADQMIDRMRRFMTTWRNQTVTAGKTIAYVDTRYPNGVAIRFNEMLADGGLVKN